MRINTTKCVQQIKEKLHKDSDLKEREMQFFSMHTTVIYLAPMVDYELANENILKPLLEFDGKKKGSLINTITQNVLIDGEIELCDSVDIAVEKMLKGFVAIIIDKQSQIVCVNAEKIVVRPISIFFNRLSISLTIFLLATFSR